MKTRWFFMMLLALASKTASSQCTDVTVDAISNFIPLSIDSVFETAGMRNGPDYKGATLYYPISGSSNYKSIVLVPGYFASEKSVAAWARYFASRGFVAMTIGTNNLYDQPSVRALALLDGMETVRQENSRITSPVYNKLDVDNIAVGGWSMGGGGAQLAAVLDTSIKAVFAITPWLQYSTLTPAALSHTAPVFILSGQIDNVAPPTQHANVHYNYTPASTKKILFEIVSGTHNTPLYPATGNGDAGNVVIAWMNLFLNNDDCYCAMVVNDSLNQNATASNFLTTVNCESTVSTKPESIEKSTLKIYPNPTSSLIRLSNDAYLGAAFEIISALGQVVQSGTLTSDVLDLSALNTGFYYLKISNMVFKIAKA